MLAEQRPRIMTERGVGAKDAAVTLLDALDLRLQPALRAEYARRRDEPGDGVPRGVTVVLAGHRAAGKSTLLPLVAQRLARAGVDLDRELERLSGRALREWVEVDLPGFRQAERDVFTRLAPGSVVAVGGGFLSLHADLLRGALVVLVPISFETYAERLRADATRPRLRPELSLEQELREVYEEREARHRAARPMAFVDFLLALERGTRPRRVVTMPPGESLERMAWQARHAGADLLEVRSDLTPPEADLLAASRALPLLVAARPGPLPRGWLRDASLVDLPAEAPGAARPGCAVVRSLHAARPLSTEEALAAWTSLSPGEQLKHVEPLERPEDFPRLLETQAALQARFGAERVTVLATGPLALPFRAVLAARNALDYLALDPGWAAAPGQRLLADAVRADRSVGPRLGILGHGLAHSRSPRLHAQPFDRIDLPADAPIGRLLEALRPHYRGFAVTAPFKRAAAEAIGDVRGAINTLVRTPAGWRGENTDVAGAAATLEALAAREVTVLGDGGTTVALREAASRAGVTLRVLRRVEAAQPVSGAVVWTWPPAVTPPEGLRFDGARVAVIAYGAPARAVAALIRARGGVPLRLGPRWFIAQARAQRALWETAA
jgi:shikimate kinase